MRTKQETHHLDSHVGLRLRRLRQQKHYSLEQTAEWLDITRQQMSRLEHGQSRMNVVQLYQLARGFDVPFSWFVEDFVDDADERRWQETMVREERGAWSVSSPQDQQARLLALWDMLEPRAKQKIIGLLEAMAGV
jgi:transcriptional regulator with XRE-family HTH domain